MKNIKSGLVLAFLLFMTLQGVYAQSEVRTSILHPKGLLWKIEKQGQVDSYLFGTMHVSDPQVTRLPKSVEQAFVRADHFVMEVVLDAAAIEYVTRASFFNDKQSLKNLMEEQEYKKLINLIDKRIFISEATLNKMKPWAVLMLLMAPVDDPGGVPLDMMLSQRATQRSLKISGLESVEEQIAIFDTMSLKDQLWLLNRSVEDIGQLDLQFSAMLKAYLAQDLAKLNEIQQSAMHDDSNIDDRFLYQLLNVRNVRMAERMQAILKQGNAFIAIGALHLPGEDGVLSLLEKQGFRVTRIY